jgi:hypothetical protein
VTVDQAALQRFPGSWVQRHRVGSLAEPDRVGLLVDVGDPQTAGLQSWRRRAVREHAHERLVRVHARADRPAAEQGALLVECEGGATEGPGFLRGDLAGRVD